MSTAFQVTFDCVDPAKLAAFWAELLGYEVEQPPEGFSTWPEFLSSLGVPKSEWNGLSAIVSQGKPRIFFQRVPERKIAKNRVHLDLELGRGKSGEERRTVIDTEIERAIGLGATRVRMTDDPDQDQYFAVLADIEGNEFCIQ